jgi:hypothetical protein
LGVLYDSADSEAKSHVESSTPIRNDQRQTAIRLSQRHLLAR